ncbi:MAG: hypothetical protein LBE09_08650, partial [Christensenellaceae bacterium]|nr:hypothetical protein [Christensenellaceae bacterium]
MKRTFGKTLIIFIIAMLLLTLVACAGGDNTDATGGDNEKTPSDIDAVALADLIQKGLVATSYEIADMTKRHVVSTYEFRVNTINLTIVYEANYDDARNEDSEILLKIYDNTNAKNSTFFYYNDGELYYEINGSRNYVPEYTYSGTFSIFYDLIALFDVGGYIFGDPNMFASEDEFIKEEDDMGLDSFANYMRAIITGAELKSLAVYGESDAYKNIRISDVSLDKIKEPINDFLTSYIKGYIGDKLDVLSQLFLGFQLSELGNVGVGIINVNTLEMAMRDGSIKNINLVLDGVQTDNIHPFYVSVAYDLTPGHVDIALDPTDDPDNNPIRTSESDPANGYWLSRSGETHLKGTLFVDLLNETFDVDLKANLDFSNNETNQFLLDVRKKTVNVPEGSYYHLDKEIASFYYNHNGDELLYISLEGLMKDYLGGGIALEELGFPKAKLDGLDMAKEMSYYLTMILEQLSYDITLTDVLNRIGGLGQVTDRLDIFIAKSKTIGGTYYELTIDNEFVQAMLGDYSATVLSRLSSYIGVDEEIIMAILGLGIFDNLKLLVGFDLITGEINISLYNSNTRYFVFSLFNQRITDTNFKVQPPSGFEPSLYKDFEAATSLHLHTEGLLYMQGAAETDLSSLLGLFIGDDTGLNSPFALTINDKLYLSADIWEVGDDYFVTATIWLNPTLKAGYEGGVFQFTAADILETEIPLIKIYTSREDPEYFLIELRDLNFSRGVVQKPVKYKASRSGLFDVFTEMRGAGNIFTGDNYNEIYDILSRDTTIELNSEWIVARLSPYNVGGIQYDPIYDILGVPNMSASLKLKISFRPLTAEDDQWAYAADESMYVLPVIERLSDLAFETMYEAKWHQTAQVYFGDDGPYDFKLTFDGDSSIIVDGIYRYMPVATLFGQDVTYVMLIKNQAIGTKYITTLVADSLQFDPIAENPIPTEIEVYYDDPTALEPVKGFQKFVIEDFGYTVDMIRALTSGATLKYYTIVIGKDSIAEMRFSLGIEILNRNFLVDEYIGNVPIVASIQIDPYEYAILMAESKPSNAQDEWIMYNPLAAYNNLDLYFGTTANQEKYPATFDWQLTQAQRDSISYHGGRFFVYSKYYTATVALEVVVVAKEIDYIQVIHILEDGSTLWELPGEYTIDSIDSATHQIPKVSTNTIQLRVYFKPAADQLPHYRIIGTSTGANLDDYCDGYYGNFQFAWKYASVDISIISLDETINTLARGTNIDTAEFINNFIGTQTVSLLVRAPTRRIQPVADSVLAYTVLDTNNGDFNLSASITELVRASDVAYRKDSNGNYITNDYIIADPLKPQTENVMPTSVSFQMMFAGKLIWKSYPIIWDKHPMVNGIYITNMLAVEAYVQITGTIGNVDGKKQTITMIIENANGAYESLKMYYDESGTQVVEEDDDGSHKITIDPYNPKALPVRLDVKYSGIDNADTFYVDGVDIYWMYESKRVDENTFNYKGGNYILTVRLPGDIEIGRLPLLVSIDVSILDMTVSEGKIYGLLGNNNTEVGVIDTFSVESAILLKNLESDTTQIGVSYQNSQTVSEIVIPVKWENAKEVIDALKGYKSTETAIILKGVIYENSDSLRQVVTCPIKINARVVESISFTALGDLTTRGALTVSSSVALDEENNIMKGTLEFDIKMPFALVNAEGGKYMVDSSGNHSNLVLYNFLRSTLSSIYIEFSDSPQNAYFSAIYTDNISEIDATVFRALSAMESDMGEHVYKFRITNIGNGSAVTSLDVSVKVHKDVLSSNAINLGVETFGEMAQLLYQDEPYYLPNEITVSYRQSGLVTYSDIIWIASGTAATVVGFDSEKNRQYITSQYFFGATGFTGQSFTVSYVIQPQSETVSLVLSFLSKNINEYNYSASAAEGNSQYNILDGILTVSNIYSFGTFDSSKIPSTIEPSATVSRDGFQTSGDAIKFISNWLPLEGYALAGNQLEFDVDKIMKEINAAFESTSLQPPEIIIGFMRLIMYDNRTQDIKLKIKVDRFVGATISREDATFDQNSTATLNIYEYNRDGVFDLYNQPTTFVFQSSTGGYVTHTFEGSELAFYIKASGGAYQSIQQIPFSYQGHELGTAYGNPNDTLTLTAYYKYDGSTDRYIGQFNIIISKAVIEKVEITNYGYNDNDAAITALIDDAYYIDPYDDTTFELPSVINVVFNTGSRVDDLAVDAYEITDGPFSDGKFDLAEFLTDQATYSGKSYTLKFNFTSFGGTAIQEYSIDVIIFDRSFTVKGDDQSVSVDNPFTFLTSDLPDISELLEFNSLEGELYKKYWNSNLVPFNLKIEWQTVTGKIAGSDVKDVVVTDDIFTIAGFDFTLSGVVKGAVEGVTINIRVFSPKLEYFGIATSDNSIMTLIEFFQDGASKNRSFEVLFSVAGSQDLKRITFIPYDSHSDASDETGTALIDWGVIESNTIRTVKFYNYYKTSDNNIIVDNKQYKYSLLQVTYAEIDFGYGYAESNEVKLVLDPFVPVIPSKVDVKGSMIDKPYNVVENQIEFGSLY